MHGYYHNTIDPSQSIFYRRTGNTGFAWSRYNVTTNVWSALPANNVGEYEGGGYAGAAYFPELGGMVYAQGGEFGGGSVYFFNSASQQWSKLADNLANMTGGTFTLGAYNPVRKVFVFGQNGAFYKLDSNGTVTALANPPVVFYDGGGYLGNLVPDPVSGKYLFLTVGGRQLYTYDVTTDVWQTQTTTNAPNLSNTSVISAPISNYGVVVYANCRDYTCKTCKLC